MQSTKAQGTIEARVGEQVAALRGHFRLSQRELAAKLTSAGMAVDASAVSRIEKGQRALRLSEAIVLADVFEVDLGFMVMGLETPEQEFRSTRRYADTLMSKAVEPLDGWLNALTDAFHQARSDPSVLASIEGEDRPERPEDYLKWVRKRMRAISWDDLPEIYIEEGSAEAREDLREIGHLLIDSIIDAQDTIAANIKTSEAAVDNVKED